MMPRAQSAPSVSINILLLERNPAEAARLSQILREAGHRVTVVSDEGAARMSLAADGAQLALFATHGADEAVLQLVRQARALPGGSRTLVALLAADAPDDYIARAIEAGVDVDIHLPMPPAILLAHVRAAKRLRRVAGYQSIPIRLAPTDGAGSHLNPAQRSAAATAWRTAPSHLRDATNRMLTLPVQVADITSAREPAEHATSIILSNVEHQLEMRVAIGADRVSARGLAVHMFGSDEAELAVDLLGEIANVFMGTMKAAFSAESIAYTGGLPSPIGTGEVLRPGVTYPHQQAFVLLIGDAALTVHIGLRSKANVFLSPGKLCEGMVLARDVINARGALLLTGGTRLSLSMIERVRNGLPPTAQLEVMAP